MRRSVDAPVRAALPLPLTSARFARIARLDRRIRDVRTASR